MKFNILAKELHVNVVKGSLFRHPKSIPALYFEVGCDHCGHEKDSLVIELHGKDCPTYQNQILSKDQIRKLISILEKGL